MPKRKCRVSQNKRGLQPVARVYLSPLRAHLAVLRYNCITCNFLGYLKCGSTTTDRKYFQVLVMGHSIRGRRRTLQFMSGAGAIYTWAPFRYWEPLVNYNGRKRIRFSLPPSFVLASTTLKVCPAGQKECRPRQPASTLAEQLPGPGLLNLKQNLTETFGPERTFTRIERTSVLFTCTIGTKLFTK